MDLWDVLFKLYQVWGGDQGQSLVCNTNVVEDLIYLAQFQQLRPSFTLFDPSYN